MAVALPERSIGDWPDGPIEPGERRDVSITLSQSYSGLDVRLPAHVWRAPLPGPAVFITAAVHGDEINGAGIIRRLILDPPFELHRGALLLVPVVNIQGFERHSRYLPDRRDLNRCFPGSANGSPASRLARVIFEEIVARCQFGIDLHTAAVRRTNFPNVRADMRNEELANLARAFGAELIVNGRGPKGSLRRAATDAGRPTLILEAGEVWKVEPTIVDYGLRGVRNALIHLGLVEGDPEPPPYQVVVERSKWVRADAGGFLRFHVRPGDLLERGEPIATNTGLTGREQNILKAPRDGVVLGMTTLPAVGPGDAVCHIAYPRKGALKRIVKALGSLPDDSLHLRVREDLGTNLIVQEVDEN
ncbi:MAG: succinylglutamate desuccinylase/aspartoacylase family protein [Phycisphaerales bacterium]